MDISYCSSILCSGSRDGDVFLWDLQTCSLLKRFHAHQGSVNTLLPLDSNTFVSSGVDGCVNVFDIRGRTKIMKVLVSHSDTVGMASIGCMTISPQGNDCNYIVTGGADDSVSVIDVRNTQNILHRWTHNKQSVHSLNAVGTCCVFSGDGEGMMLCYDLRKATEEGLLYGLSGSESGAVQCILQIDKSILACGDSGKVLDYHFA